ncbi:RHS repeat-associated core domain-containing protein [Akkermansia muciniphila]|uniref:RHS repeat domain-containing protein n=2 Tax=Akkermansia muciniphila TaxID=239935 RepID=UPI0015FFB7DA|nr:RHS repeat-associated core domain-containing protein [Akkermansia muciniphila]QNB43367.1 RHS repeat-associated core domain-containing protein [Akkermansia muciniphila]
MSKHSSCLIHRNFLVGISYSDATPGQSFVYDHLGQLTQITDAAGMRTFACNLYGEPETDSLAANGIAWQVSERYDGLGRQAGYELSADGRRVQQTHLSYDGKGRLSTLTAEGMETPFSWTYSEQGGLVEQLAYPNGMTRVNTYEDSRDLLSVIDYRRPGSANPPARHEYDYDALGRPTRRRDTWNTAAPKTTRLFTYNSRGELIGDQLRPGGRFGYQYDNIGNRKEAFEFGNTTDYETDELNRYAGIVRNGGEAFTPQYDADGNQTLVKTSTGIWTVTYNAENRPVKFESEDGGTTVECAYDSMGRRFEKKVTVGGTTNFHARYLYRDYLQVAECDLTGETPALVRSYLWDPSEPEATRVLSMTRWEANGTQEKEHLYCMHDAMKNVTSLFGEARGRRALYEYRPYGGLITSEGNMAEENKFRLSCEYMDDELGLIYYNYRHLNPRDGRWISRDPIAEQGGWNLFAFVNNNSIINFDYLGKGYLARRPLAHTAFTHDGEKYYTIHGHVYKAEGLSIQHSHFFFEDETNIGYFPDGLHEDNSEGEERKLYIKIRDKLDDCILREAIKKTPPKPYSLTRFTIKIACEEQSTLYQVNNMGQIIPVPVSRNVIKIIQVINPDTDNCNSWALRVLRKYDELVKKIKK